MKTGIALLLCGLFAVAAARAGAVLELVPDQPGPYSRGQTVNVRFWLDSAEPLPVAMRGIRLDFSGSSQALGLDAAFQFDRSTLSEPMIWYTGPGNTTALPRPQIYKSVDCICGEWLILSPSEPFRVGSLEIVLPDSTGSYLLDAMNGDEGSPLLGARVKTEGLPPPFFNLSQDWRANTGELTGGSLIFQVIPEPGSLSLVVMSAALLMPSRSRQTSPNRHVARASSP